MKRIAELDKKTGRKGILHFLTGHSRVKLSLTRSNEGDELGYCN